MRLLDIAEELGELVLRRHARLERLDLSGAQLQSPRFFGSRIAGCRLDEAACQDWRTWDTEVADCSFAGASLRDAVVGTWREGKRNTWRRVDFSGADFPVVARLGAVFEDCDFSRARLAKVRFEQCAITRRRFASGLKAALFDGRQLEADLLPPRWKPTSAVPSSTRWSSWGLVMQSRCRKCWASPLKHNWALCEQDYADRYK